MKEFLALFKSSVDGSLDEFSALFTRELKLLLGNVTRMEEIEDRRLVGIHREVASPDAISILEQEVGGKSTDLMLMPLQVAPGKVRYVVAEGSLRHADVDQIHLLKWLFETRMASDQLSKMFRSNAVYDCDMGILSRSVIPSLFEMEKSRAEDFGSSLGFLILKLRTENLMESLDLVRKSMRRTDYLFYLDNGEVLLLLVECSAHGSVAMIQRMKKVLAFRLLSSGYSIYPEQGETADDLISEAQGALV